MNKKDMAELVELRSILVMIVIFLVIGGFTAYSVQADELNIYNLDAAGVRTHVAPSQQLRIDGDRLEVFNLDAAGVKEDIVPDYQVEFDRDVTGEDTISPQPNFWRDELQLGSW